jgi:cytoskeletal protein CcmA (bactofilin family)
MFSKTRDKDIPPVQVSPSARRPMRTAPSIISSDLTVQGSLVASGDVQIDGTVEGDIRSHALTIGDTASIDGDIYAEEVTVRGRVHGTIRAKRVQLAETSRVEGDIIHESLAVETGAYFEGMCRHSDNPLGETVPARTVRSEALTSKSEASANTASVSSSDTGKGGSPLRPDSLFGQKSANAHKGADGDGTPRPAAH